MEGLCKQPRGFRCWFPATSHPSVPSGKLEQPQAANDMKGRTSFTHGLCGYAMRVTVKTCVDRFSKAGVGGISLQKASQSDRGVVCSDNRPVPRQYSPGDDPAGRCGACAFGDLPCKSNFRRRLSSYSWFHPSQLVGAGFCPVIRMSTPLSPTPGQDSQHLASGPSTSNHKSLGHFKKVQGWQLVAMLMDAN